MGPRARHTVPLSISLPPLRGISKSTPAEISLALQRLRDIFCPLQVFVDLDFDTSAGHNTSLVDSGYVSADEDDGLEDSDVDCLDAIERGFAVRWLTGFVSRAYADGGDDEEACRERLIDVACSILSVLTRNEDEELIQTGEDSGITRQFEFDLGGDGHEGKQVSVELYDTPMQTGRDHTDVGLQTWGASIVFSHTVCKAPEAFGFRKSSMDSTTRIIELGAGTGLVSLVLSSMLSHLTDSLPSIIATDYHPTVLKNLERNAASHAVKSPCSAPVKVCHLDWSAPRRDTPLDVPADVIVAADVAYAPEHATWLCHCASQLLAPRGVFWLMVSIRPNGKFEGISDGVEAAFERASLGEDGRVLRIVSTTPMQKVDGVGRADEVAYKLYKVVWTWT